MSRRDTFEKAYAEAHDLPIETFSQYRMGDTYRLPGIASHWRTWCAALDSQADLVADAYRAGFDESGEGWNGEYPINVHDKPSWIEGRNGYLESLGLKVSG